MALRGLQILILLAMIPLHSAWSSPQATPAEVGKTTLKRTSPKVAIKAGDIFRGKFQLFTQNSKTAEFVVYFTETKENTSIGNAFEVEAVAMVATEAEKWVYGLNGVFDVEYRQLILYNIIEYIQNSKVTSTAGESDQAGFHPVGFAGQISADHQTIACSIAFNGDASLSRVLHPEELEEKLLQHVKSEFL